MIDSTLVLDASLDETKGTIDSDEALDGNATKGTDFPFDPGGAMESVDYSLWSMQMQSTHGMQGHRSTHISMEHQSAIPFHTRDDVGGNASVNEEQIHWDAQSHFCHFS